MAGISTREIRNRIRSMESTRQITKAMEMVAASKLRRAQAQALNVRPYFEILSSTIQTIVEHNRDVSSPYLARRNGNRVLYVVIAGDRGLAGGYNSNVLKRAWSGMEGMDATVLPIGRKAAEYFRGRKTPLFTDRYLEAECVDAEDCLAIAGSLSRVYRAGEFDRIRLAYTGFGSVLVQMPMTMGLLPLLPREDVRSTAPTDILFEPDSAEVFASIVPAYLGGVIYGALCESRASEQAARRTAMDSATRNADGMIGDLSLKYNRARQAAITSEIIDIVAGS